MSLANIESYLDSRDFAGLFVEELGWEAASRPKELRVETPDGELGVSRVAHYSGIGVWVCDAIPSKSSQRLVDTAVAKESAEHLVIFVDDDRHLWLWPQSRDASGAGTTRLVPHDYTVGRPNEALRQRLRFLQVGIDDEVTLLEMKRRLCKAFDAEPVTKRFYRSFATEHGELVSAVEGIEGESAEMDLRWYGSILLNRLMFIYFMQRKGFLDDDVDYLRNRLQRIRELHGPDEFYGFYRDFLLPLFHEGLGAPENRRNVTPAIAELLGDIPYINGGIFSEHELERTYEIAIPDEAFERLFEFFDRWQWHLDDRPSGNANEINPDVLGYIFEQFVNNRADNGVYYTKEDVTGYMTSNTLIPVFLERLVQRTNVNPWLNVVADPTRYIWPSVSHGIDTDLPEEIAAESDVWPRPAWDATRPGEELALPGESWWEVVDRRRYHDRLVQRMQAGEVDSVSEAVSANIDLETLAVDVIDGLDSPDDVVEAWSILTGLSVLDPTCGSGAFLFAALRILDVLYDAVIDAALKHSRTVRHDGIVALLANLDEHPNRAYFVLKHATLNNLYGVDIMPEAVEIARLRLFLNLVAQIDDRSDIEPLPDLEFNIKAGNTLVGASTAESVHDAVDLRNAAKIDDLVAEAELVADLQREFSEGQLSREPLDLSRVKCELVERIEHLRDVLDDWWMEYIDTHDDKSTFRVACRPFHWFVEFPEVFLAGGFDVVIGNPPYVGKPRSRTKAIEKFGYPIEGFTSNRCPDIYAQCVERSVLLARLDGRIAMITPHNFMQSRNFDSLRRFVEDGGRSVNAAGFSRIPAGLFPPSVRVRNAIVLIAGGAGGEGRVWTSRCHRWYTDFRPHLFSALRFMQTEGHIRQWSFIDDSRLRDFFDNCGMNGLSLSHDIRGGNLSHDLPKLNFKFTSYNFLSVSRVPVPAFDRDGNDATESVQFSISFLSELARDFAFVALAGRLGLLWWSIMSDDFHVTKEVIESFPLAISAVESHSVDWSECADLLDAKQNESLTWKLNAGKRIGSWNLAQCRVLTDQFDELILDALGASIPEREAIWTCYSRVYMDGVSEN